jgi:hypothetical protein
MPETLLLPERVPILLLDRIKKSGTENKYLNDAMMFLPSTYYPGEITLKLNFLFIVMDLLTLRAYPLVFVHGKLRQFSKSKESIPLANLLVTVPVTSGK